MRKSIAILLAFALLVTVAFAGCKKGEDEAAQDVSVDEQVGDVELGFEDVEVTDENGEAVTDANGEAVTEEVAVEYAKDKDGKTKAYVLDSSGNRKKDKDGNDVTIKSDTAEQMDKTTTKKSESGTKKDDSGKESTKETKTTESTTATTEKSAGTTNPELTTKSSYVPTPSVHESGDPVVFSAEDQQIIKQMLEVPYLYTASYDNGSVPISIASHTAIWMAQRTGLSASTYASGTVVLDLFKYYGQTVVNFKSKCNSEGDCENIVYNANSDTFTIAAFEDSTHEVTLTGFEDLGGNNFYKVTGTVSGAKGVKTVTAVVQKNKLDNSLGFSIKALEWK
ncbi:MAG: hypothetical protein IJ168_01695 [Eubacterium sp.]|nr:hypothetical protein [Eubacterium sp.]